MLYRVQTVYSIFVESEKTELHCPCRSLVQKKICKNPKQTAEDLNNEYMYCTYISKVLTKAPTLQEAWNKAYVLPKA